MFAGQFSYPAARPSHNEGVQGLASNMEKAGLALSTVRSGIFTAAAKVATGWIALGARGR